MSLKASAVSRYLGERGLTRAEWHPSAQVRGWGTQSGGYRCEDFADFNYLPAVRVSWVPGDELRSESADWTRSFILERTRGLKTVLESRFIVQLEVPDSTFGGDPYLMVTGKREVEDGNGSN